MWVKCNPNPAQKEVSDCVVRAIAIALNMRWIDVYDDLCDLGRTEFNMPSADAVWGKYLYRMGFRPFQLPMDCPQCVTIAQFADMFRDGVYVIGTGGHAVAVVYGDYYDSWDSGLETVSFFWKIV